MKQLYRAITAFIETLGGILFVILTGAAFLCSAYVEDAYAIEILITWDHPLWNLLFAVVFLLCIGRLSAWFAASQKRTRLLLVLTCLWMGLGSMAFSVLAKVGPTADSGSVYAAAMQFARDDFSALSYTGSYFSCYPFQLGLAFFYECIFRITHITNYRILQAVNSICLIICVLSQYQLTRYMFGRLLDEQRMRRSQTAVLLMIIACLPYMMYGSFIYGEIPSFAFILLGTWTLIKLRAEVTSAHRIPQIIGYGVTSTVSFLLAMLVRYNTLIFIIALAIIGVMTPIWVKSDGKKIHWGMFAWFVLMIIACSQVLPAVKQMYAIRSGTEINAGIPAQLYLAMGAQEGDAGAGGYSGYNIDTFIANDYDAEASAEIGMIDYVEQMNYWIDHPREGFGFFTRKFLGQWLNTGWSIFDSTYVSFGERPAVIESMYSGALYPVLKAYMTNEMMMLYLGVCASIFYMSKLKRGRPTDYLFLLTAIGGALFYCMWEASGRYVLPYAILVMPHAALGIEAILNGFEENIFPKFIHRI